MIFKLALRYLARLRERAPAAADVPLEEGAHLQVPELAGQTKPVAELVELLRLSVVRGSCAGSDAAQSRSFSFTK